MNIKLMLIAISVGGFWIGNSECISQEIPSIITLKPYLPPVDSEFEKSNDRYFKIVPELVGFIERIHGDDKSGVGKNPRGYRFSHAYYRGRRLVLSNMHGYLHFGIMPSYMKEIPNRDRIIACETANDLYGLFGDNLSLDALTSPIRYAEFDSTWSESWNRFSEKGADGIDFICVSVIYKDREKEESEISRMTIDYGLFRKAKDSNEDRKTFLTGRQIAANNKIVFEKKLLAFPELLRKWISAEWTGKANEFRRNPDPLLMKQMVQFAETDTSVFYLYTELDRIFNLDESEKQWSKQSRKKAILALVDAIPYAQDASTLRTAIVTCLRSLDGGAVKVRDHQNGTEIDISVAVSTDRVRQTGSVDFSPLLAQKAATAIRQLANAVENKNSNSK